MLVDALRPPAIRSFAAVRIDLLASLAIIALLVANLPYLEVWPTVHNDEAREMNAFWVAAGIEPGARGMDPEFGADPLYKGGLQGLTVGLMFRVAGLGLFQGRLVSLAWGGLLLGLIFVIGRRLYGPLGGGIALLSLAISRPFLVGSHMVRPDIVLAAMLAAAFYLALRGVQERQGWASLAAGLTVGLALDVHLNAIAFLPLIGLVYAAYLPRFWRARPTLLFCSGLGLGLLYFLLVRVAPDPGQFARSGTYLISIDKTPPILSGDMVGMLAAELGRWRDYFGEDRRLELAVMLAALAAATARSISLRSLDPILFGLAAAFVLFVLIVNSKSEFYLVLFYPWMTLLLGGALAWITSRAALLGTPLAVVAAIAAPLVFGLPDNFEDISTAASNFRERGYYALVDEIRPLVPPGASILGPPLFWIGLNRHPYTDYYVWERLRAERRERFSSFAARLDPDLIVLDAKSRHQVSINSPGYLENNAALLKTIRHVGFDRVEVWKPR